MPEKSPDDLLPPEDAAAEELPFAVGTLHNMRSEGRGPPYIKRCGRIFYRRGDLRDWLAAGRVQPEQAA